MRLREDERYTIKKLTKMFFGEDAKIYLFGSRVDDGKKGGDIDLYIETRKKDKIIERKIKLLVKLKEALGDQKIDITVNNFSSKKYIFQFAKQEGVAL
jgi:uncharacterized protein